MCESELISSPEYNKEDKKDDKQIQSVNQCSSLLCLCYVFGSALPPSIAISTGAPPHIFVSPLCFLSSSFSICPSQLFSSPSSAPSSPTTTMPVASHFLSPLCPSFFPLSLLKPVKGYQAPLSIRSNSIRPLPYERFFLLSKWALAAATVPNSFKGRQARGGEMDISIRSSSLSRSPPLKGNLFPLMDTFVWMYEG